MLIAIYLQREYFSVQFDGFVMDKLKVEAI